MLENNVFNQEWDKLQKSLWGVNGLTSSVNTDSGDHDSSNPDTDDSKQSPQTQYFDYWLTEVDSFWGNHSEVSSGDIDTLYKKVSSCSRFFFNFSEALTPNTENETTEDLITKYFDVFSANRNSHSDDADDSEPSTKANDDAIDLVSYWKMPLENLQKQSSIFTTLNSFQSNFTGSVVNSAQNPDFQNAFEAYLVSLQQYQMAFIQLFMDSSKQVIETIESSSDHVNSSKHIMALWLDILDHNYEALIAGSNYSKLYADVVNSWVVMLSKSGQNFSEFMQSGLNTAWANPNG